MLCFDIALLGRLVIPFNRLPLILINTTPDL